MERSRRDAVADRPGVKPPAWPLPARAVVFRFACDATDATAARAVGVSERLVLYSEPSNNA
jgi:hypothetical protein